MIALPLSNALDVRRFSNMLEYRTQSASYKPLWLMGILEEVKKGNKEIEFKTIGCHMISKVWYPILHCKLSFGYQDSLPRIVDSLKGKLNLKPDEKVNNIFNMLMSMDEKELLAEIKILFDMVPYRLLSPFYKDEISSNFNKSIKDITSQDKDAFYKFIKNEKTILIGDAWFEYMSSNQVIIEAWIEHSMIYYLQKKNPNVPAIPLKIKPPDKRDLNSATNLWKYYGKHKQFKDIYIGKPFTPVNIEKHGVLSLDHFLPWSFVLHDEVWNLLPSFKNVNSSKSNDLPNLEVYMKDYCNLQYEIFSFIRSFPHQGKAIKDMKKIMEDYLHIMPVGNAFNLRDEIDQKEVAWHQIGEDKFKECLKSTIAPLYQIAHNQGYEDWVCKDRVDYELDVEQELVIDREYIAENVNREGIFTFDKNN